MRTIILTVIALLLTACTQQPHTMQVAPTPTMTATWTCEDVCRTQSYDGGLYAAVPVDRCVCVNRSNGATHTVWG